MPDPELAPCPFCGSANVHQGGRLEFDDQYIFCQACLCEGPPESTRPVAVAAWNRRPGEERLGAELCRERDEARAERDQLSRLNTDKFNHLQAYCRAADEDRATIARLEAERDAALAVAYKGQESSGRPENEIVSRLGVLFRVWLNDGPKAEKRRIAAGILGSKPTEADPS